ncbi:hypothetical protein H4219_003602 [Mycoemilia scoparia]|uniref:RanBD1 domain-containing protein n=1 Tax=Mycoemilia scoparia TaxID=417184 RepID=A0A9W8DT38_9FUNG|nr:hypothetical protein H4219_003602 [Mycoemilia scoparia]
MGKRIADKELTQLNQFDDDNSDDYSGEGEFKRANESELSRRVIKKPKSRLKNAGAGASAATTSASNPAPKTTSLFSGISGFGAPKENTTSSSKGLFSGISLGSFGSTPGSSGFSFGKPAEKTEKSSTLFPSAQQKSDTNSQSTTSATSDGNPLFGTSNSTESSAVGKSNAFGGTPFSFPSFKSDAKATDDDKKGSSGNEDLKKPYMKLRGLNVSFKKHISEILENDPFCDISEIFAEYTKYRKDISATIDSNSQNIKDKKSTATETSATAVSTNSLFSAGGSSEKTTANSLFGSSAGFSLTSNTASSNPDSTSKPAFGSSSSSGFQFGSTATDDKKEDVTAASKLESSSSSSIFGKLGPKPEPSSSSPFAFGSTGSDSAQKTAGSGFGSMDTTSAPQFSFSKLTDQNTSSSLFGTSTATPSFGFGSNSSTTTANAENSTQKEDGSNKDSFGDEKEVESKSDNEEDKKGGDDGNAESTATTNTTTGEEGEVTVHSARVKLYKWDSKNKKYSDMGVGNLKINESADEDGDVKYKARLLCRQEGTNKITLNCAFFKTMLTEHTEGKKEVGVVVVEEGRPVKTLIRIKTPAMAKELYNAIISTKDKLE